MIQIAIVEDDPGQVKLLREYLDRYEKERGAAFKISCYSDGDGITQNYQGEFDIILMDIDMPFVNGYEAAQIIRDQDPEVVILFITNLTQYAIKGYSVGALDYVLKPVTYFAFSEFMTRALGRIRKQEEVYLTIRQGSGVQKLAISRIYYVESKDHYLIFYTKDGDYRTLGKISDAEKQLAAYGFLRCHVGYLVNPAYVGGFEDDCVYVAKAAVPVSRSRKKAFFRELMDYMNR